MFGYEICTFCCVCLAASHSLTLKSCRKKPRTEQRRCHFKASSAQLVSGFPWYVNIYIYIYIYIYLYIYLYTHTYMHACIHPSIHRSIHRSIHPSIHRSIDPSIHPSIHPYIICWRVKGLITLIPHRSSWLSRTCQLDVNLTSTWQALTTCWSCSTARIWTGTGVAALGVGVAREIATSEQNGKAWAPGAAACYDQNISEPNSSVWA